MDALELLKQDHQEVKELFEQGEGKEGKDLKDVFMRIKKALDTHARIEETVFYPASERAQRRIPSEQQRLRKRAFAGGLLRRERFRVTLGSRLEPTTK